jgi:hypothetical protein
MGLIHRDIKPSNVMREQGGNIVLMDFGSAVELQGIPDRRERLNGTPLTMAPEVLVHGESPQPTSDIYGLGVLLYWLVSARYPVEARDMLELVDKHRRGQSVPLLDARSDLPVGFAQIVERTLAVDPAQRYPSAGEMQRALCAALGAIPQPAPGPGREGAQAEEEKKNEEAARKRLKRLILWGGGAVAATAVAVYLILHPPAPPFDVHAALFRAEDQSEERLLPGSRVGVGDRIFLEVEGSLPMYVYVLDADEKGEAYVLMDPDPKGPLAAGMKHRLPGMQGGRRQFWIVSSAGGRETIFVIASRKILPELERMIAGWPRVSAGGPQSERPGLASLDGNPRGIGMQGLEPSDSPTPSDSLLPNLIHALLGHESESKGIWFWQIHLLNDGS